jgi:glycosyltransferase involved in cell wall biosynthesis
MTIFNKLRIWGVKGAIDYLFARLRERNMVNSFRDNAKKYPCLNPEVGITVVGALSDQGSLNKVLRDFCFSLKDAGIPFQTWDLGSHSIPPEDIESILTLEKDFQISRYTHLVEMICSPVPDGIVMNRGRIVFWEFESGLLQGYPVLEERTGDIIAMSDFNYNYYRSVFDGERRVSKILYPLRISGSTQLNNTEARVKFGISEQAFVVFYNFSYKSGLDRKNPEGALRAFSKGLGQKPDAVMVLKTASGREYPERVAALKSLVEELGISDKVIFVDDYLSQRDVMNLTNTCDVYLSLHRAEGFGLGIAEAMSLGKAVVVTDYSSTTEFCNPSNSIPIGYEIVKMLQTDNKLYSAAEEWAEPNIEEASAALRELYEDSEKRLKLGIAAKDLISNQYSIVNFKESIMQYLYGKGCR